MHCISRLRVLDDDKREGAFLAVFCFYFVIDSGIDRGAGRFNCR
jgi:hypothetical protein